jgi:maltose phosphorylase
MSFVMGFGGMRVENNRLIFNPFLPESWKSYSFKIDYAGAHLKVQKERNSFKVTNLSNVDVPVTVWGEKSLVKGNSAKEFNR